jgi:hypothetical protein
MRESIGGTWIFSIVIVFIVLFTGYLAVSVNYSKAFKVKNGIINLIEKDEGLNQAHVSQYLKDMGYEVYGSCKTAATEEGHDYTAATGYEKESGTGLTNKYKYCVATTQATNSRIEKTYYRVTVFFRLDLPIVGDLFTFKVTGESKGIYYASDTQG